MLISSRCGFVSIAEELNMTRAARREHLVLPAASKRLKDLEEDAGAQLLYRHARGVTLTPAGLSFLHHARQVLSSLERMNAELSEYAQGVKGHIRIHANTSAIAQFLPANLKAFMAEHPLVKIDLEEARVARGRALRRAQPACRHIGRRALRHRIIARLGRERRADARRAGGARGELRAHPSLEPDRHGCAAAASARRLARERDGHCARRHDRNRPRSRGTRAASPVQVCLRRHATGEVISGEALALLDTERDVALIREGGIIPMILRRALN
jgi:DNA-binding transcriptional LysR family regulator